MNSRQYSSLSRSLDAQSCDVIGFFEQPERSTPERDAFAVAIAAEWSTTQPYCVCTVWIGRDDLPVYSDARSWPTM